MVRSTNPRTRIDTEALKRERPLPDVVASYGIALRREGAGRFRALCPFHQERTPSFWIDARDSSGAHYYCFGCSAHGDVLTFVMDREGCSFVEACERLSTRSWPPVLEPETHVHAPRKGRVWEDLDRNSDEGRGLDEALRVYEEHLWQSDRAREYLRRRGIPEEVARVQRLGYADGHRLLQQLHHSPAADAQIETAVALGLVLERPGSTDADPAYREFFLDRLIVPELRGGHPIWLIGRAIEDAASPPPSGQVDATGQPASGRVRPKYLGLSGEKPIIGLEHVAGRRTAFICEGPLDWLAAASWGLPAFAICGTHFPPERLPSLGNALAVYGVFDPDRAGQSAAERFAPLFGSRWRPVRLPNGLDLAEVAAFGEAGRDMFNVAVGRARAAAWQQGRV